MRKRRSSLKRGRNSSRVLDEQASVAAGLRDVVASSERLSVFYAAGPMLRINTLHTKDREKSTNLDRGTKRTDDRNNQENTLFIPQITPLSNIQGAGQTHQVSAHGQTLSLEGRTDASFSSSFRTKNVRVRRGTDCENCGNPDCRHLTGTLVATYSVTTTVTLPRVNDFPDLTRCQRTRVQNAITNILAPHEQQHVAAFRQYKGMTRRQFDLTLCRSDFDSTIQAMFEAEERVRRAAAQAASDALDPFNFDVDLNCEDRPNSGTDEQQRADINPMKTVKNETVNV